MFARVTIHKVKPGRMEEAKAQVLENTKQAKKEGFLVARYMMLSKTDPNRLTSVTVISDKAKYEKWAAAAMAKATVKDAPWASIDGDEYEAFDLMK